MIFRSQLQAIDEVFNFTIMAPSSASECVDFLLIISKRVLVVGIVFKKEKTSFLFQSWGGETLVHQ